MLHGQLLRAVFQVGKHGQSGESFRFPGNYLMHDATSRSIATSKVYNWLHCYFLITAMEMFMDGSISEEDGSIIIPYSGLCDDTEGTAIAMHSMLCGFIFT